MGRAQNRIFEAVQQIRNRTRFSWRGIDSDNDNAFINDQLYRYTQKEGLVFTWSRPYRKNDNAYIEQKNFTHIRGPLGYLRYDTSAELDLIHDLVPQRAAALQELLPTDNETGAQGAS